MNENDFKGLRRLVNALSGDNLTAEEFTKAFEAMLTHIKKVEEALIQRIETMNAEQMRKAASQVSALKDDVEQSLSKVKAASESTLQNLKQRALESVSSLFARMNLNDKMDEMMREHAQKMQEMDTRVDEVMKMVDAKMAGIPLDIQDTPQEERDRLESLKGNERLDITAIKGVDEMKTELKKEFTDKLSTIPRGNMGMRKVPIVRRVNLTSQVDGSTRAFTVPLDTVAILGLFGTQFPITFDTADWTFAGRTITLATAIATPTSGQTLFALTEALFYA